MSPAAGFPGGRPRPGAGAAEPAVHIDRLALRVAGLDEGAARTLARLVAEGLAPWRAPVSSERRPRPSADRGDGQRR